MPAEPEFADKPPTEQAPLWQKILRKAQALVNLLRHPLTMGVRAIALDDKGRVFLVRHTYAPGWSLPGGGVEPSETAVAALARELEEEGALTMSGAPQLIGLFLNRRFSRRDHVALYLARGVRQSAPRPPDWEIANQNSRARRLARGRHRFNARAARRSLRRQARRRDLVRAGEREAIMAEREPGRIASGCC